MTDEICGAETANEQPCQNPAGENGYCWVPSHNPDTDEENPHGRPSKLTEDTADSITSTIAEGKSVASAARMAGIHPATVYSWLDKGEESDHDVAFEEDPYGYFHDRFVRARGLGEDRYFDTVFELAQDEGDLETLMAMLKQRYPESWGEVDRGEQAGGVIVNVGEPEEHEIDEDTLEVID